MYQYDNVSVNDGYLHNIIIEGSLIGTYLHSITFNLTNQQFNFLIYLMGKVQQC